MDANSISNCEKQVMKVIWDTPEEMALQEIMTKVNAENGKEWKPQTVSTFLARLVRKNFLTVYRKGRYSYYQPAISKKEYWKATMKENARYFNHGDMGELACALCNELLSKKEREDLQKALK
ncbi:MAG: BlaI/MecI/CopY family transcriptional regulator [Roseburia sp.]